MTIDLKVSARDNKLKPTALRQSGLMPAVYYGRTQAATAIAVPTTEFERAWREAGESTVVTLNTPSGSLDALIADVDLDPITYRPRHADFYVFEEGRTVEVAVPLEFVGTSPAVKEQGAVLVKVMHELRVEADPRQLPPHLEVNISDLKDMDSQILAKDITLPKGVELTEDPEEVVASVYEPTEETEEPEAQAVDFSNIEVEKKGKEETPEESE